MTKKYCYFVEGECEEKFINIFKAPPHEYFLPGKVVVFNFINKRITNQRIALLEAGINIILVYDTDITNTSILKENIRKLKNHNHKNIYHIQSIKTFEDEIVFATDIQNINSFYGTDGSHKFKTRFIRQDGASLTQKLESHNLDLDKIWSRKSNDDLFNIYYSEQAISLIRKRR